MDSRRVVITGIGVISPNGIGKGNFWTALKEGKSGVREITLFDASDLPTNVAGEVSDFNDKDFLPPKLARNRGRSSHFAIAAAQLACEDAGLDNNLIKASKAGISIGTTFPAMDQFQHQIKIFNNTGTYSTRDAYCLYDAASPNVPAVEMTNLLGFIGFRTTVSNACSSGATAILYARQQIREKNLDLFIAGGIDASLTYFTYAGFIAASLQVVSSFPPEKISRPYDRKRTGAICSEGAAFLVLEEMQFALNRGATVYGEIVGAGESVQIPAINGQTIRKGLSSSMSLALSEACVSPADIDYICSHGPSLIVTDEMETLAIKDVFGKYAYKTPVSSIKSMIGNPFAASAPMQIIAALMGINESIIPPTINLEYPDPACDLDYVPNKARKNIIDYALIDSHGLDNIDVSIVISKYNG